VSRRALSIASFREKVVSSRWKLVFGDIAHILLIWSFVLKADPSIILSYDLDVFRCLLNEVSVV
jgi:hypothetical protein